MRCIVLTLSAVVVVGCGRDDERRPVENMQSERKDMQDRSQPLNAHPERGPARENP
jgi:hypothetical protein